MPGIGIGLCLFLAAACGGEGGGSAADRVRLSERPTALQTEGARETRLPVVEVYKSPTCGCCAEWVEHLKAYGFPVRVVEDEAGLAAKKRQWGIGPGLSACHTGEVEGYVVEGHVPAEVIARFLDEPPEGARGLAVPGMPRGSPGMEGPEEDPYDVLLLEASGATQVYESRR